MKFTVQETTRSFLRRLGAPKPETGCIEDSSAKNGRYGSAQYLGRQIGSHIFAFIAAGGYVPPGRQVLHTCDNKACVNPYHLYLGDHKQNMRDAADRKRMRPPRGRDHSATKLTEEQVREIKANHLGLNGSQWAKRLGVANGTIYYILNGRNWRHIS